MRSDVPEYMSGTHSHRRRSRRRNRLKARIFLLSCLIAAVALALAAVLGAPIVVKPVVPTEPRASEPVINEFAGALPPRPVYRYSVVDGGVYSAAEMTRVVATDSVVADHYRGIDVANVRAERVAKPTMAYMSYRRNGTIYWTKHKVQLQQGETILTDGNSQVRARCGNCISLEPMQPTAPDEPEALQFDALTPEPVMIPSRGFASLGPGVLLAEPLGNLPMSSIGSVPMSSFAGGFDDPGAGPNPSFSDPGAFTPPDVDLEECPGHALTDCPGSSDTPDPRDPPVLVDIPPVTPPIDVPPDFDPDPPGDDEDPPAQPVPEPGTLLLVGGGALSLAMKRARARRSQS